MSSAPIVELFTRDIDSVVDKYREEGITVAEVVGALELVKLSIVQEADADDI